MLKRLGYGDVALFRSRFQSVYGGAKYYDKEILPDEHTFNEVYHDVWRIFFTPSKAVREWIEREMETMNLVPGEFAAVHLRALYARVTIEIRKKETVVEWTRNALNCASELRPGGPFLFASDHPYAIDCARSYGLEKNATVVARNHDKRPIHIDKIPDVNTTYAPSDFYDTFVDVLMMGLGRCATYNRGGFGHWGLLIGYNASCEQNQKTSVKGIGVSCNWTEPIKAQTKTLDKAQRPPLFLEPMDRPAESKAPIIQRRTSTNAKKSSLPDWMIDYFSWHKEKKLKLNPSNWNSTKYLVMTCTKRSHSCGGVSDRLKPLPFVVLQAFASHRLLLIYWNKPALLEEYLVPPDEGVDWRVPDWLIPKLNFSSQQDVTYQTDDLMNYLNGYGKSRVVVKTRIQSPSAGEGLYAEQLGGTSTYQTVYHELFRAFFRPSPRLQSKIQSQMNRFGLVPGQYASAHLRAMYGNREWRDPRETIRITVNAINCASELYPGGPVYFAADIKFAIEIALAYGQQRHLPVVALTEMKKDPLHLDKDDQWRIRDPSAYDDTFLDLLLLGSSRCVAYSNGGYGSFGQLLSYDSNCTVRYFRRRHITRNCTWTHANGRKERFEHPVIAIDAEMFVKPLRISSQ